MINHSNLFQKMLFFMGMVYAGIVLPWYNPFAYDTSAPSSPIGSARQEERYEAKIETIESKQEKKREVHEGQEADTIETMGLSTISAQKKASRHWATSGPERSEQADDVRMQLEVEESARSAVYGSKR